MPVPKGKEESKVIMIKSSPFKVIGPDGKKVEEADEEEKSNKQSSTSRKEYKVNAFKVPKKLKAISSIDIIPTVIIISENAGK